RSLDSILVSGIDVKKKLALNNIQKVYAGSVKLKLDCTSLAKVLKDSKPILLASLSSQTGLINWNESRYRGAFKVIGSDNLDGSCNLVNEVPLEDYINSLLAKEMHNLWPLEALKAQ